MSKITDSTILTKPTLPGATTTAEAALAFVEGGAQVKQAKVDILATTRLNANIPVELHRALKVRAASEGKTIGQLVEDWIKSWAVK